MDIKQNICYHYEFFFYGAYLTILHKWYKLNGVWSFLIYEMTVSGFRVLKLDRLNLNIQKEVGKMCRDRGILCNLQKKL